MGGWYSEERGGSGAASKLSVRHNGGRILTGRKRVIGKRLKKRLAGAIIGDIYGRRAIPLFHQLLDLK